MDNFVNLHNHSDYSLLDGFGTVDEYIARAVEMGQPALGLTDHGNVCGLFSFIQKCNKAGIKPIPGIEAYVAPVNPMGAKVHQPVRYGKPGQEGIDVSGNGAYLHMTLWAMNDEGLHSLYALVREASMEGNEFNHLDLPDGDGNYYMKPRMDLDMLARHNAGLIATTGCPSGEIQTRFRLGQDEQAYDYARRMSEIFEGRYFVELMDHGMAQGKDIERVAIPKLLKLADDLNLPLLATNDSHYCNHEDAPHHEEMLCANSKATMYDLPYDEGGKRFAFNGDEYYLKTRDEMLSIPVFHEHPEAVDNTMRIADMVERIEFKLRSDLRPEVEIPDGYDEIGWFKHEIKEGLKKKRSDASPEVKAEAVKRINHELPVFTDNNFVQYMLVVKDYIDWARSNGIRVGYGRGCFLPGSRVRIGNGIMTPIEKVKVGSKAQTHDATYHEVEKVFEYDVNNEDCVEITFNDGTIIRCTADHMLFNADNGFMQAQELHDGSVVLGPADNANNLWDGSHSDDDTLIDDDGTSHLFHSYKNGDFISYRAHRELMALNALENDSSIKSFTNDDGIIALNMNNEEIAYDDLADDYVYNVGKSAFMVKSVRHFNYTGKVYDLQVEGVHNYTIENRTVHNSVGGSEIAFDLNISDTDPIRHNLMFERFLNPERLSPPDVDTDFAASRRDEVVDYVKDKYGEDHIANIITFNKFLSKTALADMARIYNIPVFESNKATKLIPEIKPNQGASLSDIYDEKSKIYTQAAEFRRLMKEEKWKPVIAAARAIEGRIKTTGVHACGIIMSSHPITDAAPMTYKHKPSKPWGSSCCQWTYEELESIGLIKMDFLSLSDLDIVGDTLANIMHTHDDKTVDIDALVHGPMDDKPTYDMLSRGETLNVFQLSSCLDANTIINVHNGKGMTIKSLYDMQESGKELPALNSVFFNDGRKRPDTIKKVVASGKKDIYRLTVQSDEIKGWFIDASAQHRFMTDHGWKELHELKTGDRILAQTKIGQHNLEYVCADCDTAISSEHPDKNTREHRCYKHSATHYSNPSKPESKEALSKEAKESFQNGRIPWQQIDDPKYDESKRMIGKKVSESLKGRTIQDIRHFTDAEYDEYCKNLSIRMSGKNNPMYGKKAPNAKGGFRDDLGHYVRSSWEADFARVLKYNGLDYDYEPEQFELTLDDGRTVHYTPDFYVKSLDTWFEIKGFMRDMDAMKIKAWQKKFPGRKLVIIDKEPFAQIQMKYSDLVIWECPEIPSSFGYVTIESIEFLKHDDTYDIIMNGSERNFIANGFVVHNSGMQALFKRMHPKKFEDIQASVALYRPGPMGMDAHNQYADRAAGKAPAYVINERLDKVFKNSPVDDVLKNTENLVLYQEQIMNISRFLSDFSWGDADALRKGMGHKKMDVLNAMEPKFINNAVAKGYPREETTELWEYLKKFGEYGFNSCFDGRTLVCVSIGDDDYEKMRVEDIYREHESGAPLNISILSMYPDGSIKPHKVKSITKQPLKAVTYTIRTESGKYCNVTGNHRMLTTAGYGTIDDGTLRVGAELMIDDDWNRRLPLETLETRRKNALIASMDEHTRQVNSERMKEYQSTLSYEDRCAHQQAIQRLHPDRNDNSVKAMYDAHLNAHDNGALNGYGIMTRLSDGRVCDSRVEAQAGEYLLSRGVDFELHKPLTNKDGQVKYCDFYADGIYFEMDGLRRGRQYFIDNKYGDDIPFVYMTPGDYIDTIDAALMRHHVSNGDRIISIEPTKTLESGKPMRQTVYDIEMEHDGPANFIMQGIVSHNSHAASYAIISYETAYLKCHYPAEFMAAVLTDKIRKSKDVDDVKNAIREVREIGLKVGAIDIDNSDVGVSAVKKTSPDDPDIVFGISGIKGVSIGTAQEFVAARAKHDGKYTSVDDFMRSLPASLINKKFIDGLAGAGAFDKFGVSRRGMIACENELIDYYKSESKASAAGKESLFDFDDDDDDNNDDMGEFHIPEIQDWDWIQRLVEEEKRLGVAVSGHPLSNLGQGLEFMRKAYEISDDDYGNILTVDDAAHMKLNQYRSGRYERRPSRVIASIASIEMKTMRTGRKAIRGTIESETDSMPFAIQGDPAEKWIARFGTASGLQQNHVYVIVGNITIDYNGNHVMEAVAFEEVELDSNGRIPVWIQLTKQDRKAYKDIRAIAKKHPGDIPLMIHMDKDGYKSEVDSGLKVDCSDEFMFELEQAIGRRKFGRYAE